VEDSDRLPALADVQGRIAAAMAIKDPAARQQAVAAVEKRVREIPAESVRARRKAIEDLYWSVLSSNEFLFNH
jgi:hypothetical protein